MTVEYLLVPLVAFVAAIISGLGGFGGGFIVIIALAPVVGAKSVVPLISVYATCANISRIVVYRKTIDFRIATTFILSSTPTVYLGATFLAAVPERVFMIFMGTILIITVPMRRYLSKRAFRPGLKTVIGFGLVFGFVSGAAAGSGLLAVAAQINMGLQGTMLLGTDAVIGMVNALSRVGSYWALGLLDRDLAVLGVLMGLCSFPGTWVASIIVSRMGVRLHTYLMEILIVSGGVWFLYQAAFGLPKASQP